jgi:hypothetical protein
MTAPVRCFVAIFAAAITLLLSGCGNTPKTTAGEPSLQETQRWMHDFVADRVAGATYEGRGCSGVVTWLKNGSPYLTFSFSFEDLDPKAAASLETDVSSSTPHNMWSATLITANNLKTVEVYDHLTKQRTQDSSIKGISFRTYEDADRFAKALRHAIVLAAGSPHHSKGMRMKDFGEGGMDINARLEKVERENRRMKKIGIVTIVFASVLFISGQEKTNKVVEANEFVLKDGNGRARAKLSMVTVSDTTLVQKDIPNLSFYDAEGHSRIFIAALPEESRIYLSDSQQTMHSAMWAGSTALSGAGASITGPGELFQVTLDTFIEGPQLVLKDKEGYSTEIGRTEHVVMKTGTQEQTPAASVVLFDKDKKVLWAAP